MAIDKKCDLSNNPPCSHTCDMTVCKYEYLSNSVKLVSNFCIHIKIIGWESPIVGKVISDTSQNPCPIDGFIPIESSCSLTEFPELT